MFLHNFHLFSWGMAVFCLLIPLPSTAQTFTDPKFVSETIGTTGAGVISIAFGPGDRMYAIEKRGRVMVFQPDGVGGYQNPTVFADLQSDVDTATESGLLGIALDPDFANNRNMYLLYTTQSDQRLVRIMADSTFDQMTGNQEVILSGLPRQNPFHKAGDIGFHPTDPNRLYIALGDDGIADASQDLDAYEGKILRIDKNTGMGLVDNPFYDGGTDTVRARIWSIGHRNPFRFAFHPDAPIDDVLYVSENGNRTDRISWVQKGSNGAWNSGGDNGGFLDPPNDGPGAGSHIVLATDSPILVGIAIVRGGPFADPDFLDSDVMYVANLRDESISRWRLTGPNLDVAVPIATDGGTPFVTGLGRTGVDLVFGPDGWLYYTASGINESVGNFYKISRIRREGGDTDGDGDGVPNATDNCPEIANPGQENNDGDAEGDVCDDDDDNDGVLDADDAFPFDASESVDTDGDGMGDNFENRFDLNPNDPGDADLDNDSDGSTNLQEFQAGRNPDVNEAAVLRSLDLILD